MATEDINEPVSVIATFMRTTRGTPVVMPELMSWRGRRYRISRLGLRYPLPRGRRVLHRFTFSVDDTAFELEFDAETLSWQLLRLTDGYAA